MSGPHDALCINSFYPKTELNVTEIQGILRGQTPKRKNKHF